MKERIYKYQLETTTQQVINLPVNAEILTVQNQNELPCLWALVDSEQKETEERYIEIFGTGHDVGYDMGIERKYIATYQLMNGNFIGHVFERIN